MIVERPSVCTLDCPDTCSLTVTVENDRIVKVRGSDALAYTGGVICNKVARESVNFVHGENRLHYPLRRTGPRGSGMFERIGWSEALDLIHARVTDVIARHGAQAVMPFNYAGPHGLISVDSMSLRFFHKLGATKLFRGALCGAVRSEAWLGTFGNAPGISPEAAADADLNLVWGNNATVTNLHLVRAIWEAKRKGGRLAVVDPLRSKVAERADLHLALRPGTDVVLGFALAAELERRGAHDRAFIERNVHGYDDYMARAREWSVARAADVCGVPAEQIHTLAGWMAAARRLVLSPGNGLERGRNGGSSIRALIALPALLGKLDRQNGIVLAARRAFPTTPDRLTRPDLGPGTRTLNIKDIGRHLATDDIDPPLRALFIYNHNPIVVHPDQNRMKRALAREDVFLVGIEIAMTESMQQCDIVLPAATHFEYADLYPAYGHHWLQRAEPVIAPLGESLPNTEIFRRLAARFGFDDACFQATDAELMDAAVDLGDAKASELSTEHALQMKGKDGKTFVLFENVFPATPSGRIELRSEALAQRWGDGALMPAWRERAGDYPLMLISPASDRQITSTLGFTGMAPRLMMHPRDATARGLVAGSEVKVWNERGEVVLPLDVTDDVPPGVVASEKGTWIAGSPTGQTISALVSADMRTDLADGACFNDTLVEVTAA